MNAKEGKIRKRLRDDFEHYAPRCLRIRSKAGEIEPFELNRSQKYVHEQLQQQLAEKGNIRALILKARQWGCSTYVEGRFYWKVSHKRGTKAFILTHLQDATDNIFGMVSRFHEHCPPLVKPHTGAASAKELAFDNLDSSYKASTAGSKAIGRSDTIQMFHGSEVAYWPNAPDHIAGVFQAVPRADGTEIILESTANGPSGVFHDLCKRAMTGDSEYMLIFVPWFWHEEYAIPAASQWKPPTNWLSYESKHELSRDQLYWAYLKNKELAEANGAPSDDPCWQFRQEYPATPLEAFQVPIREGRVYKNFTDENIVNDILDMGGTLMVGLDFNVNPICAVLASRVGDQLHVWDEITIHNGNTDEMSAEIRARYPDRDVCVYPDPSGKARKTSAGGKTDFTILESAGFRLRAPNKAPAVVDRINEVNGLCMNSDKIRRLFVHERCTLLIQSLRGLAYKKGTSQPDKGSGLDHPVDALGYLIHEEFPIYIQRTTIEPLRL